MAVTPISPTKGTVSSATNKTVKTVFPVATNDATHVQQNPDHNRILMRLPNGHEYSSLASYTQGTTLIVLEPA